MIVALVNLAQDHSILLALASIGVCFVAIWLMLALLDEAKRTVSRRRVQWMAATTIIAGLGIWLTHFIATLGFRADFVLSFDPLTTATSAMVSIATFGVPIALSAMSEKRALKATYGAIGGIGISVMHVIGMAAITNCVIQSSSVETVIVTLLGSGVMALALSLRSSEHRIFKISLATLAVCIIHFGLISVSEFVIFDHHLTGITKSWLGTLVSIFTVIFFVIAVYVTNAQSKLSEQTRQRSLLSTALTNMSNGLVLISADGRVQLFNDRVLAIFGLEPSLIVVGMRWQDYLHRLAPALGWSDMRLTRVIANHERWFSLSEATYLEHALEDGRTISVACRPISGGGAVLTYDDITAERHAQKKVEQLAFQDVLTGLPNRRMFQIDLENIYRNQGTASLLLIDLDHFKYVNDTLGHAAGDALLIEVGHRLTALCDCRDHIARIAGDEFTVITSNTEEDQVTALCQRIVRSLGTSFRVMDRHVTIGCSVGYASTANAKTPALLVQYADLALYRAKKTGRGHFCGYEAGMREAAINRLQIEADLRSALDSEQFHLVFQPIYQLNSGSGPNSSNLIGFEALVRWQHPTRGSVSPADFIPIAEETGLIREIGQWIVQDACRQAARWPKHVHIAINVSPTQLRDSMFSAQLAIVLAEHGISASRVVVELTETALVDDSARVAAALRMLKAMGIQIAMDDFGTGYSSFTHLRDFDLDWIKIDQSFVQIAPLDPGARAVLEAIVHMAKGLGVRTIGEGVETPDQLGTLARSGCHAVQGYHLSRPITGDNALRLCQPIVCKSALADAEMSLAS